MKHRKHPITSLALFFGLTALMPNAKAQSPAPMPRDELGRLVLPDPTPEQREQGKQLLEKILSVVLTIPLTDGEKVLNELGFQKFRRYAGPQFEDISAEPIADASGSHAGQGFYQIRVVKVISPSPGESSNYLSGRLQYRHGYADPCIHVDDAMVRLKPLSRSVSFSPIISTQPSQYSPKQKVDLVKFSGLTHAQGNIGGIVLSYEKQFCAFNITIHYTPLAGGTQL